MQQCITHQCTDAAVCRYTHNLKAMDQMHSHTTVPMHHTPMHLCTPAPMNPRHIHANACI